MVAAEAAVAAKYAMAGHLERDRVAPHGRESSEVMNLFAMPGD